MRENAADHLPAECGLRQSQGRRYRVRESTDRDSRAISKFLHIRHPPAGRPRSQTAINTGVRALVEKHGGEITAASNEDEMTILDMIENREELPEYIAVEARAQAKELCAKAVH